MIPNSINTALPSARRMQKQLVFWLLLGCFLVFGMVIIGGITRLTGSGLSITEWKVITGAIPPLTEAAWQTEFEKYKQIPQYQAINSHFELSDFKFIYFWEYFHRLFGRLIGVVFLVGYIYFEARKAISKSLRPKLWLMFLLGGLQGFLGWYMVSSGLTENIRVSHIRLAIHFTFAFITFGYVFYVALSLLPKSTFPAIPKSFKTWTNVLLGILLLQIIYGAFVAGTKAGLAYNTWPKMNDEWIAQSVFMGYERDGISSFWNNLGSIQFIHRNLAYIITALVFFIWFKTKKELPSDHYLQKVALGLVLLVLSQVTLGIITLLLQLPLWIAITHQVVAFILFATIIYFRWLQAEPNRR